ncbi:hypothetical protein ACQP25_35280 [Microtetraspora malaysiensis]|uniref:hypothetical protein n=1 Tax=Microtetraspora malaysiensis TaxID=161358 RepID=UPI003D9505F7
MTRRRGLPVAVTVISYAAAVFTLTWLTIDNRLGDQLYGHLLMLLTAFPASVPGLLIDSWLYSAVIDNDAFFTAAVRDFLLLAWPGAALAAFLSFLLVRRPAAGRALGMLLTGCVILSGLAITFDEWPPRRPYGWPFFLCGLVMLVGLLADCRRRGEGQ